MRKKNTLDGSKKSSRLELEDTEKYIKFSVLEILHL